MSRRVPKVNSGLEKETTKGVFKGSSASRGKGKGKKTLSTSPNANSEGDTKRITRKKAAAAKKTEDPSSPPMEKCLKTQTTEHRAFPVLTQQKEADFEDDLRQIVIDIHPMLQMAPYMADLSDFVRAHGILIRPNPAVCHHRMMIFTRTVSPDSVKNGGMMELAIRGKRCHYGLYVMTAEEMAPDVQTRQFATNMLYTQQLSLGRISLVIYGVQDYFNTLGRKNATNSHKYMSRLEFEMALADLLVYTGIDSVLVNSADEARRTVVQICKALSEKPNKLAQRANEEQAAFYMKGDNKKCIAVDKDGMGLSRVWQQMLAVLPNSGLEVARAVCPLYKSPALLHRALLEADGVSKLSEVGVCRSTVPGAKSRRLGPEFARKLHILFTAQDGDAIVE